MQQKDDRDYEFYTTYQKKDEIFDETYENIYIPSYNHKGWKTSDGSNRIDIGKRDNCIKYYKSKGYDKYTSTMMANVKLTNTLEAKTIDGGIPNYDRLGEDIKNMFIDDFNECKNENENENETLNTSDIGNTELKSYDIKNQLPRDNKFIRMIRYFEVCAYKLFIDFEKNPDHFLGLHPLTFASDMMNGSFDEIRNIDDKGRRINGDSHNNIKFAPEKIEDPDIVTEFIKRYISIVSEYFILPIKISVYGQIDNKGLVDLMVFDLIYCSPDVNTTKPLRVDIPKGYKIFPLFVFSLMANSQIGSHDKPGRLNKIFLNGETSRVSVFNDFNYTAPEHLYRAGVGLDRSRIYKVALPYSIIRPENGVFTVQGENPDVVPFTSDKSKYYANVRPDQIKTLAGTKGDICSVIQIDANVVFSKIKGPTDNTILNHLSIINKGSERTQTVKFEENMNYFIRKGTHIEHVILT
jgi:hypothetical protein